MGREQPRLRVSGWKDLWKKPGQLQRRLKTFVAPWKVGVVGDVYTTWVGQLLGGFFFGGEGPSKKQVGKKGFKTFLFEYV